MNQSETWLATALDLGTLVLLVAVFGGVVVGMAWKFSAFAATGGN